jgi:phosphocarrier protein HPr
MPTAERRVTVINVLGLHVRPAAKLAAVAMRFQSDIRILRDSQEINAKSSLDLLTLAASHGVVLTLRASGEDAEAAVAAIADLIASGFGEEKPL